MLSSTVPTLAVGGQTGNLSGTIVDGSTKAPISGVAITAASPSGRYSATTDARGFFQINGMTVDTYTVSFSHPGYETSALTGVTIQGDQTLSMDVQTLQKQLRTIGRVTGRSQSSVFQPTQTQDAVTVSGTRLTAATGKAAATSEQQLALSVPGVQQSRAVATAGLGAPLTIRGGLSNEVGYQFDGVPFREPYNGKDAANGAFNGLSALQVVAGAGDASQGNVGSGVLNFTVKRGTRPATGLIDLEVGSPFFNHQLGIEYGFATPNTRFSNYFSFIGQRLTPAGIPINSDVTQFGTGQAAGLSYQRNDDFINNMVYKFGRDNNQSLQFLVRLRNTTSYLDNGGFQKLVPGLCDPRVDNNFFGAGDVPGYFSTQASLINSVALPPGYPTRCTPFGNADSTQVPLRFVKFEYTNALNASTYLSLRTYNYDTSQLGAAFGNTTSGATPVYSDTGGSQAGILGEITKTINEKNTITLGFSTANAHPRRNDFNTFTGFATLAGGGSPNNSGYNVAVPSLYDFEPLNAAGVCPDTVYGDGTATTPGTPIPGGGCYLAKNGISSKIPGFTVDYLNTDYLFWGYYIRDQFTPTRRIKIDVGGRVDSAVYKQGFNPNYSLDRSNPTDVDPSYVTKTFTQPSVFQPRGAIAYQLTNNDALRFGYGRSINFAIAQTFGTPAGLSGLNPAAYNIAPLPGTNLATDPTTWTCGSGYNTARLLNPPAGSTASPNAATTVGPGGYYQCRNYGEQLFWLLDQQNDAPDVGNNSPPTYSNYDLTAQHQFKNGVGLRLTGFAKRGYSLPVSYLIKTIILPDGSVGPSVFAVNNIGINRSSGAELGLTLPDRPYGFGGYLTMTYTNVFNTTPPLINSEDQLPLVSKASLALNNVYRAGFVSPFTANAGVTYKTRSGFKINPILNYDRGYPTGAGNTQASGIGFAGGFLINNNFQTITQSNFDPATYPAIRPTGSGFAGLVPGRGIGTAATNFVDPVHPGSYFAPNIAATRGTPESANAGGVLTRPRLYADVDFEYSRARNTFGVLVTNLFNNEQSEPVLNPLYQPVATGVAGPNTGLAARGNTNATGSNGAFANQYLYKNIPSFAYNKSPYISLPNNQRVFRFYYQLAL